MAFGFEKGRLSRRFFGELRGEHRRGECEEAWAFCEIWEKVVRAREALLGLCRYDGNILRYASVSEMEIENASTNGFCFLTWRH